MTRGESRDICLIQHGHGMEQWSTSAGPTTSTQEQIIGRWILHALMAMVLIAGIAYLIETTLSRGACCPDCGRWMVFNGVMQEGTTEQKNRNYLDIYYCRSCDYEVALRGRSGLATHEPQLNRGLGLRAK